MTVDQTLAQAAVLAELAPGGTLRAAVNVGNPTLARRDPETGALSGKAIDLTRALAERLGVPAAFVVYEAAGRAFEAAQTHVWDIAFLAIDTTRAERVEFSSPYMTIEATYLVETTSAFQSVDDIDRPGVRIAVAAGAAYDHYLSRTLRHAAIVHAPSPTGALRAFREQGLEAVAGVREGLEVFASKAVDLRLIDGRILTIDQGIAVPRGHSIAAAFVDAFVRDVAGAVG